MAVSVRKPCDGIKNALMFRSIAVLGLKIFVISGTVPRASTVNVDDDGTALIT